MKAQLHHSNLRQPFYIFSNCAVRERRLLTAACKSKISQGMKVVPVYCMQIWMSVWRDKVCCASKICGMASDVLITDNFVQLQAASARIRTLRYGQGGWWKGQATGPCKHRSRALFRLAGITALIPKGGNLYGLLDAQIRNISHFNSLTMRKCLIIIVIIHARPIVISATYKPAG